ncbi:MAG TPA: LysM peptidoglycan-binding domain-containing protein [Gammaproteobacteria bacterium]|nr:LysM peptidoglycan-binding domain-containing protein [Gammaproteobacteria bacterium]HET7587333.1 LysM peptidoglycan-binding domain-containing protein [Gammaproteobacteria bacterium]
MTPATRIVSRMPLAAAVVLLAACASNPAPVIPPAPAPVKAPPPAPAPKPEPELKRVHPTRYVVKKGDTLWDIAKHFLKSPWLWPDIWYVNPQIRNPHLIYPGDVIELRWVNGKPQLTLAGADTGLPVVHLHPKVRSTPIEEAIPTIPISMIRPFLARAPVVTEEELEQAPYVLTTADNRLLAGTHQRVYVRGIEPGDGVKWMLVRKGEPLVNPQTGALLGYQAVFLGTGQIVKSGDPATMELTASERGIQAGDRLLPYNDAELPVNFYPHAPTQVVQGQIISVLDGMSQVGQYDVVALDRGVRDGMEPGTVLAIYQIGRLVEDPYSGDDVKLPQRRAGVLMVFRTFDKVSYGLVMELTQEAHVLDLIKNP